MEINELLTSKGRYKPSGLEALPQALEKGLRGDEVPLPSITCYNHVYEGLGIAMDIDPSLIPPDLTTQRRDILRFKSYVASFQALAEYMPNLRPTLLLPDLDLEALGTICQMPEGVQERSEQYRRNLGDVASQYEIPVTNFSQIIRERNLTQIYDEVLARTQEDLENILAGEQSSTVTVPKRDLEYQVRFDTSYYNGKRNAGASADQIRRRVILNFALYATQKEIMQRFFGPDFIFLSLESPIEDKRYKIRDKSLGLKSMPIIYPVKFSEDLQLEFTSQS